MSQCLKILWIICLSSSINAIGQADSDLAWIQDLAKEVQEETDLCERCQWIPPAISEIEFNGQIFYFLRFGCSNTESVARMYEPDGTYLGECKSNDDDFVCNPPDVNAFITYTFASKITVLWSCETGFDCTFALENNIALEVPIFVDDTRCTEGLKTLKVADRFVTYNWEGANVFGTTNTLEVDKGGNYAITVTDENDCTFFGNIDIPDISKLNVKIKGTAQICTATSTQLSTTNFQSYQWSTGSKEATITVSEPREYQLTVTNEQNCEGLASFVLQNFDLLTIEIGANQSKTQEGNPVEVFIKNTVPMDAIVAYNWTGNNPIDCATCEQATFFPQIGNQLQLTVLDENGCLHTADFSIAVESLPLEIYAPNVFSPNSKIGNERFTLFGASNLVKIENLVIFDRWGNLVFEKNDFLPNEIGLGWDGQWNGKNAQQEVYLYQARVLFANDESKLFFGDVLLLEEK